MGLNMDMFNIICGVCSVLGLLVSIFTANRVVKISKTTVKISGTTNNGVILGGGINDIKDSK